MAMARAPTTSSSQLAGRNEANEEDDEEELLDAVPFAAVSCDSKFRIVNDKTYFRQNRILQNSSA